MKKLPPWFVPFGVGAVLRVVAALSGYGWFAPDDYEFAIQQGGDWLADPAAPFESPIRSPILSYAFLLLLRLARALGLSDPAALLQAAYLGLGVWSLAAIPGVWVLTRRRLGQDAALQATWLMGAYALMPRIATRALIEVIAIPLLIWGLWALDLADAWQSARRRLGLGALAGVLLGAATLVRFQLGILFAPAVALCFWPNRKRGIATAAGLALGGSVCAVVQAAIDLSLQRFPFETIYNYLVFNQLNASSYGTSAWYVYVGHFLLYSLPPATLILARPFLQAAKTHTVVAVAFAWFVGVHMCIGHKEDRFMYSALPLFFVLLGAALAEARSRSVWGTRAFRWFWAINAAALCVGVFSDAQRNLTVPLLHVARQSGEQRLAAIGYSTLPRYYAGTDTQLSFYPNVDLFMQADLSQPTWVLTRHASQAAQIAAALPQCTQPHTYAGDFADRVLVALNPRHNGRRAPTALLACGY